MLSQPVQGVELFGCSQALCTHSATGLKLDARWRSGVAAGRAHAAFQGHRPAPKLGLQWAQIKACFLKLQLALYVFQPWRFGLHAQIDALEHHVAFHLGFFQVQQGQAQLKPGLHVSAHLGLGQRIRQQGVERRFLNQSQDLGCTAGAFGPNLQQGLFGHVGDFHQRRGQQHGLTPLTGLGAGLAQTHARTVKLKPTLQAAQARPRCAASGQQGGGHHVQQHVFDAP